MTGMRSWIGAVTTFGIIVRMEQVSWRVCAEAPTGREALQRVKEDSPDVILLGFQMPDQNGIDNARQVAQLYPQIPILMVTIHLSKHWLTKPEG